MTIFFFLLWSYQYVACGHFVLSLRAMGPCRCNYICAQKVFVIRRPLCCLLPFPSFSLAAPESSWICWRWMWPLKQSSRRWRRCVQVRGSWRTAAAWRPQPHRKRPLTSPQCPPSPEVSACIADVQSHGCQTHCLLKIQKKQREGWELRHIDGQLFVCVHVF